MKMLERIGVQQSHEDAQEIVQILTTVLADYHMASVLRQQIAAVMERAERIVRNTEIEA